jgi:hypothetical protein
VHSRPQSRASPAQFQYVARKMLSQFPVNTTKSVNMAFGQVLKFACLFNPSGKPYGASTSPYSVTPKHAYMNINKNSNTPMLLTPGRALIIVYIRIRNSFMPFTILNKRMILFAKRKVSARARAITLDKRWIWERPNTNLNVRNTATHGASPGTHSSMVLARVTPKVSAGRDVCYVNREEG